jgi:hypothetical protein
MIKKKNDKKKKKTLRWGSEEVSDPPEKFFLIEYSNRKFN